MLKFLSVTQLCVAVAIIKAQTPLHGHQLRTCCTTPPTDKLTTILQQIYHIAMPEPNILGCGKFLSVGGEFVVQQIVELLWARPLVVSVAVVRVVEFGTKYDVAGTRSVVCGEVFSQTSRPFPDFLRQSFYFISIVLFRYCNYNWLLTHTKI